MANIQQTSILDFFERVALRDERELNLLARHATFRIEPAKWIFTLPDLHAYLREHHMVWTGVDYKLFRKSIFDSPINQRLKALGAEIVIIEGSGKVDSNVYALVWAEQT